MSRRRLILGFFALLLAIGLYFALRDFWWRPEVPAVDLAGIDPAVRQAIEAELAKVRQAPRSGATWGRLGMVLNVHMFADEALPCYRAAERLDPDNPRWPYYQGLILMAHDPGAALPKVREAVELCEDEPDAPRLTLAKLYLTLGQPEQAREEFRTLLKKRRRHPRAHLGLARLDVQAEDWATAREHLTHALDDKTTRKAALTLSAEIYQRQGDLDAARQEQARRLQLPDRGDWPDAFVDELTRLQVGEEAQLRLVASLDESGRRADARSVLSKVLLDYPQSAQAWTLLAWLQLNEGNIAAADQALDKSLRLEPDQAKAWLLRGTVRLQQKQRPEAIACFRQAIACKGSYLEAHFNLGVCLQDEGNPQAAIAAFQSALRCQPLSAPVHARLGALLLDQGRREEAIVSLEQAVSLNPDDSASRKLLAKARRSDG
jgi:tetratricopeptide (TPR) repeat protein